MCCNTKRKIADGLLEVLKNKPLRKVTVQDIMVCKNMKRQSFYYHFQDIYDVVEWMFREDYDAYVTAKNCDDFEQWIGQIIELIQDKHMFYRKVVEAVRRERIIDALYPLIREQVHGKLEQNENLVFERFVVRSFCHFMIDMVELRQTTKKEEILDAIKHMVGLFRMESDNIVLMPVAQKKVEKDRKFV